MYPAEGRIKCAMYIDSLQKRKKSDNCECQNLLIVQWWSMRNKIIEISAVLR